MGRAERRAAERAARREETERRQSPVFAKKIATMERIAQHGITPKDLQKAVDKAWKDGYTKASDGLVKGLYAAMMLSLHELHGFGHKRLARVLRKADDYLITVIDSQELIDKVWDDMEIEFRINEGIERIREV